MAMALRGNSRDTKKKSAAPGTSRMALGKVPNAAPKPIDIEATLQREPGTTKTEKQSDIKSVRFDDVLCVQELSDEDSVEDDDVDYPAIEILDMPPKDFDEYMIAELDPEEKEMFMRMERLSDLIPTGDVREMELEYEPMPDDTLMTLDMEDEF